VLVPFFVRRFYAIFIRYFDMDVNPKNDKNAKKVNKSYKLLILNNFIMIWAKNPYIL